MAQKKKEKQRKEADTKKHNGLTSTSTFGSANDRTQHIENEHPGKLYYPTSEDFENRLNR